MQDSEWIVGRKEIMAALHMNSWRSVVRWKRQFGVEFIYWPDGKPTILRSEFNRWILEGDRIRKERRTQKMTSPCASL
jgi:hypothetical protein